jgi:hypothetical protein
LYCLNYSYVGSSHWATILDSISEIKRELEDSSDEASDDEYDAWRNEEPLNAYDQELPGLLRSPRRVTKAELLSFIPPKAEADTLVSLWFRAPHPYKIVLHAPQFQNEYRQFWRSQTSAPVMWLGVLYGMFGMATLFKIRALGSSDTPVIRALMQKADLYQELAASAAVLGNYMKPKTYTIECLLLHAGSNKSNDYSDLWVLMGVFFRLALHMGYHRDPSHYKNVSVLDAEMRRRVWHLLYMFDTIVSFQLGLPAMLRTVQSDTRPPSNLYDQDFSIHSKALPPPRPVEQLTPSAYIAAKFSLCEILALAADVSHAPTAPSYTEVMELDARFEAIRAAMPPGLQFQDLQLCLVEDPESLMCRFGLDLLCLKIKVVLHRRFMVATASQAAVPYSRISVIGSAMRTLEHHRTIYRASCPGGQLESVSWYMCSIGTYDFLLASMIICLELAHQLNKQPDPETDKIATREDMIAALEASKQIWEEAGKEVYFSEPAFGTSRSDQAVDNTAVTEIRKACRAMTIMLGKVRKDQVKHSLPPAVIFEGSITMPAGIPAKDEWSATDNWINQNDFSTLDNIMNVSNDIDWVSEKRRHLIALATDIHRQEMWDQQLSQQQAVNPQPLPEQFSWTIDDMLAASAPGIPLPDMSLGDYPEFL